MDEPSSLIGSGGRRLRLARWAPAGESRATILLLHGYAEHLGRYNHVIAALTNAGYAVRGLDHHGHGRSGGRRAACRRFDDFVDDAERLLDTTRAEVGERPLVLLGHSMGGLIATRLALRRQADLAGLVLSGAAFQVGQGAPAPLTWLGALLARVGPDLPVLAPPLPEVLSRDPEVRHRFAADRLCYHGRTRAGMGYAILRAGEETRAGAGTLTLPLLIIHGADDRLINPAGAEEVYRRAASPDKTLRLWPGLRHEVFNEPEREAVLAEVVAWLEARFGRGAAGRE